MFLAFGNFHNAKPCFLFKVVPLESACSLCGADTQSPDFRPSDHGENLCGRGTISCPLCAKTFSLWSHYEAHKKCHQKLKQRQYPCQTCGKVMSSSVFKQRTYLHRALFCRSSPRLVIATCIREFIKEFGHFNVRLAVSFFARRPTYKSIKRHKATFKPRRSTRRRNARASC